MTTLTGAVHEGLAAAGVVPGDAILAGISGGPDSTALLRALAESRVALGLTLTACIVDHGLRATDEIAGDLAFSTELCHALGVPLEVARLPRGECVARARRTGRSMEEVAREERHRLLHAAARAAGARWIALGHTQDDVIETLLMRLLQGSDVHGLRGIALKRGALVRPLIHCSRSQVLEYLASLGQAWREDPSNEDIHMLRNRVRHLLMPVLRDNFPGYRKGLLTLARKLSLAADLVQEIASGLPWSPVPHGYSIDTERFREAPVAARTQSLLQLYDSFRQPPSPTRLPGRFLLPVGKGERFPSQGWIVRGYGVGLRAGDGRLFWGLDIASRGKKGYFMVVSDTEKVSIRETGIHLRLARRGTSVAISESGGVSILAADVEPPLILRSKRKGDEIHLEGGVTSVKELLVSWKVPADQRGGVPILVDRKGVLAVVGGALGFRTRARVGALAACHDDADRIDVIVQDELEEGREQQ